MKNIKKLVLTAVLVALAVSLSFLGFPVGVSRCYPVQHLVNILCAVLLGPNYAVLQGFLTSTIRIAMGTGTFLAYPGSMCGALLASIFYRYTGKKEYALVGEIFGTGILGAYFATFIAKFFMAKEVVWFGFILPFSISSFGGAILAYGILLALEKTRILQKMKRSLEKE